MTSADQPAPNYKDTLHLPKTDFPMKAGLPRKEPEILARWQAMDLYGRQRAAARGKEKFILHDGPPYANGHLHMGHALNKILKDIIPRSRQMMGYDANYVPGWDCHGLPIEWKIEEQYRARGKDKDDVPVNEFRRECREFAGKWIKVQSEEFQRLGVIGDWKAPYTTMAYEAEAQIARELMKFAVSGQLYRGSKPVMWSVVEKTALAEAEVEYHDYESDTIWVKFRVISARKITGNSSLQSPRNLKSMGLEGAYVLIWTTTPWTIPGNRAISFSARISYGLYEVSAAENEFGPQQGERFIVANSLAEECAEKAKLKVNRISGIDPAGLICRHPFWNLSDGYRFLVPMLDGDHVTEDAGTGFVHTAPGHGREDYDIWTKSQAFLKKYAGRLYETVSGELSEDVKSESDIRAEIDNEIPFTVDANGTFTADAPGFVGRQVITSKGKKGDANQAVISALIEKDALFARGRLKHQYPHSWRSKKPVIFRNTPQWFISMGDGEGDKGLRRIALKAIDETAFFPPSGQNRLRAMITDRPDWIISRQRAWGVPITVFYKADTGEILQDPAVNARIADIFEAEGADAWFAGGAKARFLGNDHDPDEWEQVMDILDVWFDSGSTHAYVLEQRDDLKTPASLYLEGSDQHRGWFHSSLLESCGTRGRAPYEQVLTHGFILDEKGEEKMSKSQGNTLSPLDVMKQSGADILRLWVASSDYMSDIRFGPDIVKSNAESYRRLRNTLRFLLGNLDDWSEDERVSHEDMPELERWVLHRLHMLDGQVRDGYIRYEFMRVFNALFNFCTVELSAFYFDIRKDALYCDKGDSLRRRAARTVLDHLFHHLVTWFAPMLSFTMEEVWQTRFPSDDGSVHLQLFSEVPAEWLDNELNEKWKEIRKVRRVITGALEVERREKRIGSSLESAPVLFAADPGLRALMEEVDMAELCITSGLTVSADAAPADAFRQDGADGLAVVPELAAGEKCLRCWRVLPDVGNYAEAPGTCGRCAAAVSS